MSKIIRTKTRAEGGITEEEKEKMKLISDKWIKIAYRTDPIDREKITKAIEGLYEVSGLKKPRVVIVPSPLVMALAGSLSSAIWEARATDSATYSAAYSATYSAIDSATRSATRSATYSATRSATNSAIDSVTFSAIDSVTFSATRSATYSATYSATRSATYSATRSATNSATYSAIDSATRSAIDSAIDSATNSAIDSVTFSATNSATYSATYSATRSATYSATRSATESFLAIAKLFLGDSYKKVIPNLKNWSNVCQGGNMWAAWPSYLEACRDVLGLDLPEFKNYQFWEDSALEGGFRYMYPEFCMVCDFPEFIKINNNNQAHAEGEPSHRWRDGFSIWTLNGVQVERWMAETPREELDARKILEIENVDQRREVLKRLGVQNLVRQLEGKIIDTDYESKWGKRSKYELLMLDLKLDNGPAHFLKMNNLSVNEVHVEAVPRDCMTVEEAINWRRYGDKNKQWKPDELS